MSEAIVLAGRGLAKTYAEGSIRTEVLKGVDLADRKSVV